MYIGHVLLYILFVIHVVAIEMISNKLFEQFLDQMKAKVRDCIFTLCACECGRSLTHSRLLLLFCPSAYVLCVNRSFICHCVVYSELSL